MLKEIKTSLLYRKQSSQSLFPGTEVIKTGFYICQTRPTLKKKKLLQPLFSNAALHQSSLSICPFSSSPLPLSRLAPSCTLTIFSPFTSILSSTYQEDKQPKMILCCHHSILPLLQRGIYKYLFYLKRVFGKGAACYLQRPVARIFKHCPQHLILTLFFLLFF